jgi:hypothetical protein
VDEPKTLRRTRPVPYGTRTVTVRELSLRELAVLAGTVRETFEKHRGLLDALQSGDGRAAAQAIAELVQLVPEQLPRVVALVSDATEAECLDSTPRETLALLVAAWEVNGLTELLRKNVPTPGAAPAPVDTPKPS